MFNGLPQGLKRKRGPANSGSHGLTNGTNGTNGHHDIEGEENDWSDDEDGFDSTPMDVSLIIVSVNPAVTH